MVICLERGVDLHMAQLMPLPLTVCCFSKIQIGFTFLVPAHPGSPGQRAVKRVCVLSFVTRHSSNCRRFDTLAARMRRGLCNATASVCRSVSPVGIPRRFQGLNRRDYLVGSGRVRVVESRNDVTRPDQRQSLSGPVYWNMDYCHKGQPL